MNYPEFRETLSAPAHSHLCEVVALSSPMLETDRGGPIASSSLHTGWGPRAAARVGTIETEGA